MYVSKYLWKSVRNPVKISMKYQWKPLEIHITDMVACGFFHSELYKYTLIKQMHQPPMNGEWNQNGTIFYLGR